MSRRNLRELRSAVKGKLGQEMVGIVQPAEIDRILNKGYFKLNKRFEKLQSIWTATSTADKALYRPPADLLKLDRVEFQNDKLDFLDDKNIRDMGEDIDVQTPEWTEVVT